MIDKSVKDLASDIADVLRAHHKGRYKNGLCTACDKLVEKLSGLKPVEVLPFAEQLQISMKE